MRKSAFRTVILGLAATAASLAFLHSAQTAADVPEPAILPQSWELDFKFHDPERVMIDTDTGKQSFWFVRYTITNNSGQDVIFTPSAQLLTDTGQIIQAGKDVPGDVFKEIKKTYNNPFMESPIMILGKLLQGADNAKDGVFIFSGVDADARRMRIIISGLSGETAVVKNPLTGKDERVQKAMELTYDVPGQAIGIDPHPQFKGKEWVMR